jgi:hypothetical protein
MAAIHWKSAISGDWGTAANWSSGTVPGAGDDVTISIAGTYTVTISDNEAAHSLTLNDAGATVVIGNGGVNTFSVGTTLSLAAGTLQLNQGAKIVGGTLSATGGAFNWAGGELLGVTYEGALNMTSGRAGLVVSNLTLKGVNGTGPGTINMGGQYDAVLSVAGGTLDNATVNMSDGARYSFTQINLFDPGDESPGLTLGAHLDIVQTTGNSGIGQAYNFANNSLVNDGTISTSGGSFGIGVNNVVNNGLIAISGGAILTIDAQTLTEGSGGKITVATGSTLHLGVDVTTAELASITSQGKIGIGAGYGVTLDNAGSVLTVGTGTNDPTLAIYANGAVQGGTIVDKGSGLHVYGGLLSNATFDGTLDLTPRGSAVTLYGGLALAGMNGTGPGTIDLSDADGALSADGNLTLDNATLNVGGYGGDFINVIVPTKAGATLTLGSSFDIVHTGDGVTMQPAAYAQGGATIVNDGTITAAAKGGNFVVQGVAFTNNGQITIGNGDTFNLNAASFTEGAGGSVVIGVGSTLDVGTAMTTAQITQFANAGTLGIAGTLNNTGATLQIGAGTGEPKLETQASGDIIGGTIINKGSGVFFNGGTLSGVTFEGTVDLTPTYSTVVITNGLTATGLGGVGAGAIDLGFLAFLRPEGGETLDNATVDLGYANGIVLTDPNNTAPVLTFGGNIGGGKYSNDLIINDGVIIAAFTGGSNQGFSITTPNFTNNGSLIVGAGQTMSVQPGNLTNLSGTTLTGGVFEIEGGSTMELDQNVQITTLDATVILDGAGSTLQSFNTNSNSQTTLDATLATIGASGTLEITGGRNWATATSFTNAGTLEVGGGTFTAPGLVNAGLVSGYGVIAAALTNAGTLSVAAGETLSLVGGSLTNLSGATLTGGAFTIAGGGVLQLADNVSIGTLKATIDLTGAGANVQSLDTATSSEVTLAESLKTIGSNAILGVLGGDNFATGNTIANVGTLSLGGGTFTAAGVTDSGLISGYGDLATMVSVTGAMTVQGGKTLSLVGGTLANLAGTTLTGGKFTVGAGGTLQLANNTSIVTLDATIDLAGAGALIQGLNTSKSSQVNLGASLAAIGGTGTLQVLGGSGLSLSNAVANGGTIQLGGGVLGGGSLTDASSAVLTGFGTVASVFSDLGKTTSAGGALAFRGVGDTFSAALSGTEIDFSGGTDLLQNGASLTASTVGLSGGASLTLAANQSFAGKLMQGTGTTLALGSTTLTLTAGSSMIAGTVSGTNGTLAFSGGAQAIAAGAVMNMAAWSITGGTTSVDETLTFKGAFTMGSGATLTLGTGDKLTVTGPAMLSGLLHGASSLKVSTATVSGLTIGGTDILSDAGTMTQTGAVTVGDKSTMTATLQIAVGATYTIKAGAIGRGAAANSTIADNGTLVDAAAGTIVDAVRISDTGSLVAATGTFDAQKALLGTGSITIDAGATLEADLSAAATISLAFDGAKAGLALKNPSKFAATISGFATSDTIDLLGKAATSATLEAGDKLVIRNGTKAVATLQLAGTYAGDTFALASDGAGGTDITLNTAAARPPTPVLPFIAAMAAVDPRAPAHLTAGLGAAALPHGIAPPRADRFA